MASAHRPLALVLAALALLTTALTAGEAFEEAELRTIDLRFVLRGPQEPPTEVTVVAVDPPTLAATTEPWPFPLTTFADAIERLAGAGAAVIVVDVPFGPGDDAPGADAFRAALAGAAPVVLATARTTADGTPSVLGGPGALQVPGVLAGDARFDPDDDGVVRRFDHTLAASEDDENEVDSERLDPGVVPTLPIVAAQAATGDEIPRDRVSDEGATIDHPGPAGTVRSIPLVDLLRGDFDSDLIRGRVVVIGPTAPALQDRYPTPLDERTSGTEIHAAAVTTVLRGLPLSTLPLPVRLAIVLAVCLVPIAVVRLRTGTAVAAVGGVALLHLLVAQLAFRADVLIPVLPVLAGLGAAALAVGAAGYLAEARGGARLQRAFHRYVPEAVARDAVREDGDLLRAVDRDATILFGDLRGFTTLSETRQPDEVVGVLNDYLRAMADIIIDEGGVVTGYLGDGIMAVFGVPDPMDEHADRALTAAIRMLDRMDDLNDTLADALDGDRLRMGIGLNAGPVTAGNLGSEQRLEYSVVGDAVNTASRIEGMSKHSPFSLLLSDAVRRRLSRPPADLVEYDTVPVRGRSGSVTLWSLERTRTIPV